jgi:hypothetical protein
MMTTTAARITYAELKAMLMNPAIPDQEIAPYLTAVKGEVGPFDPVVIPDPERVILDPVAQFEVESAIDWGNGISRWRRRERFKDRLAAGDRKPILVSEGDSWFQFPFLIKDVIDHLAPNYLIWSLDAAGDTADNMIRRNPEFMQGLLDQQANDVQGLLLSAAGNDIIGEDAEGVPVITRLLKRHRPGMDAAAHIDGEALRRTLVFLDEVYREAIATVRKNADFRKLPIIIHGYDYAIPGGQAGDKRFPLYADQDEWLGAPLAAKGINDPALQQEIIRLLIDELYAMLRGVAGESRDTGVYVVDARNSAGPISAWADEIHPTSAGFALVAKRFDAVIGRALAASQDNG